MVFQLARAFLIYIDTYYDNMLFTQIGYTSESLAKAINNRNMGFNSLAQGNLHILRTATSRENIASLVTTR